MTCKWLLPHILPGSCPGAVFQGITFSGVGRGLNVMNHFFCCFQDSLFFSLFWQFDCDVLKCGPLWVCTASSLWSFLDVEIWCRFSSHLRSLRLFLQITFFYQLIPHLLVHSKPQAYLSYKVNGQVYKCMLSFSKLFNSLKLYLFFCQINLILVYSKTWVQWWKFYPISEADG